MKNRKVLGENEALRLAAALLLHAKRGDTEAVGAAQSNITTHADAMRLNAALLLITNLVLARNTVDEVKRAVDNVIAAIAADDLRGTTE